jgi:exonuclease V gamma subunit
MITINKLTLSPSSTFSLNNKKKRTPSMSSIAPLLQRIKNSFLNKNTAEHKTFSATRRSNTVYCCLSEKQEITSVGMYITLHISIELLN